MIWYLIDIGFCPTDAPTNINQIQFVDNNRPFTIMTDVSETPADGVGLAADEAYQLFVRYFDGDASAIACFVPRYNYEFNPYQFLANQYFPSIYKFYPNYFSMYSNAYADGKYLAIRYKKTSRILLFTSNGGNNGYKIIDIGENGELTFASTGVYPAYAFNMVYPGVMSLFCQNYSGPSSITQNSLKGAAVRYNYPNYEFRVMISSQNIYPYTSFLHLFGASAPDGEGTFKDPGPYEPGGDSGEGDLPPGTFDDTSDPIPDSSLPTLSAADTGFTRIYNPTLSQVQALARYLWTEPSIIDTIWNHIKQFFEDPMQAIIGFNLVPCKVPDGGTRSFSLMFIDTGIPMTAAANQFVDVDCGTVKLDRFYGSALDQNPYTKVSCFLPYIGTVHLNTDEVMGTTLRVKYRIDIVSGICVAKILVDESVLYQYSGHCAITIPISSADFSSYVSAAITVGTAVAGIAAGAGVGAAIGASSITSPTAIEPVDTSGTAENILSSINKDIMQRNRSAKAQAAKFEGVAEQTFSNTVGQVMSGKMQVEHSGSFSGNSGYLGVRRPYIIVERPNMCLPTSYGHLNGYPAMITLKLGGCNGFTRVQQIQLTGCTATNTEQSEILQFLKSGVIL